MYLLINFKREHFLAKYLLVWLKMHVLERGTAVADSFSHAQFSSKQCSFFFPQLINHQDKQVTIVLGIGVNKYDLLFQF